MNLLDRAEALRRASDPWVGFESLMARVDQHALQALREREKFWSAREAGDFASAQFAAEQIEKLYGYCHGNAAAAARALREYRNQEPGRSQP